MLSKAPFARKILDLSDLPTRHNYFLALWQMLAQATLVGWLDELGVPIKRGFSVTNFAQDETGVDVALSDGRRLRAEYLVGCDGGRSMVRQKAEIELPGYDATTGWLIAEVKTADMPPWGVRSGLKGISAIAKL